MQQDDVQLVHVIFKTHLDVGFTDYAGKVIDQYMTRFIPDALALAYNLKENHPDEPFCWTVGSWLIYEYLQRSTSEELHVLETAIRDGFVTWHGIPFTTHTEAMDKELFRFGLSLSKELDERFNRKTISGKMTDVPGHTRAMIPLLAEAGIRFFHVGVNPAASLPDVPPLFKWVDEASNTSIYVMYQQVYGDVMVLPGTAEAVALVFTGDNDGPPTIESVHETYAKLRKQFPNAEFIGSTLDDVAHTIIKADADLPVVTSEIGDTWIQGIGTDPTKGSQYRELLRLRLHWMKEDRIAPEMLKDFQYALMMIPEHTWGMDLKTHLKDYSQYDTQALLSARELPNFRTFEKSWQEQRDYINATLDTLNGSPLQDIAKQTLASIQPTRPIFNGYQTIQDTRFESAHWSLGIDLTSGAINYLKHKGSGRLLADGEHPISQLMYETFSTADYDRYWYQYIRDREFEDVRVWAHLDNTKPNLQVEAHGYWYPSVKNVYFRDDDVHPTVLIEVMLPEASQKIGAPQVVFFEYIMAETLHISVSWFDKPACRLPEAFWLGFNPRTEIHGQWHIHKLGSRIDPSDVISKGARTLHGFDDGVSYQTPDYDLKIDSLDALLVAPDMPSLLNFTDRIPTMTTGMHFNLYNNVWGTNFPMWFEDDACFRFSISLA